VRKHFIPEGFQGSWTVIESLLEEGMILRKRFSSRGSPTDMSGTEEANADQLPDAEGKPSENLVGFPEQVSGEAHWSAQD
jgi:hypothetical protein